MSVMQTPASIDSLGIVNPELVTSFLHAHRRTLLAAMFCYLFFYTGRRTFGFAIPGIKPWFSGFPGDRLSLLNGIMVMFGALGAATATLPANLLLVWIGWRELFGLFAVLTAACAGIIYCVVPETTPIAKGPVSVSLRRVYADPHFWWVAPLSAACIGTAWALQGLWTAQWLTDVDGLDRAEVAQHLFAMAIALQFGCDSIWFRGRSAPQAWC